MVTIKIGHLTVKRYFNIESYMTNQMLTSVVRFIKDLKSTFLIYLNCLHKDNKSW